MALLGMTDPRRPSKDIEAKKRRNSNDRRGDKRDFSRREPNKQRYLRLTSMINNQRYLRLMTKGQDCLM